MIGDATGSMYTGHQGVGNATVFDWDSIGAKLAAEKAQKAARAAKDQEDSFAGMNKAKPEEVWHYYSAEANDKWANWVKAGAAIMTNKAVDNLWKSTDPDAVAWQIEGARLRKETDNIKQAKASWDAAMNDIGTRGDKYTHEYQQEIKDFGAKHTYAQLASGDFEFPQAKFYDPGSLYESLFVKDAKDLSDQIGKDQIPSDRTIHDRIDVFFSSPEKTAETQAAMSMYNSLPDDKKERYVALAERMGWDDEPWKALSFENYKGRFNPAPRNMTEDAIEYAKIAPKNIKQWVNEDNSGVTKGGMSEKLANSKMPMEAAKSHFTQYNFLLDDPGYMGQLGVSMDVPRDQRRKAAEKAFAEQVRMNLEEKISSSVTRTDAKGPGDADINTNFDQWRKDIGSYDPTVAMQAAKFLFGTETQGGPIAEATVKIDPNVTPPFKTNRWLVLTYNNEKEANDFKKKFYDEAIQGSEGLSEEQKQMYNEALDYYKSKTGNNVVSIPVQPEYEQVLKRLHDKTARKNKTLYQRVEVKTGSFDNIGLPTKKVGGGLLDDL